MAVAVRAIRLSRTDEPAIAPFTFYLSIAATVIMFVAAVNLFTNAPHASALITFAMPLIGVAAYLVVALRADPIELGLGRIVTAEEPLRDDLKLLVLNARRLVGPLVGPVGFVDDEQVEVTVRQPNVERRQHHLRRQPGRLPEYLLDGLPPRLLSNDEADPLGSAL